ncbi:hypothetical protein AM202_05294, partial [Actinobacillus minor 202]
VVLYQLSYSRIWSVALNNEVHFTDFNLAVKQKNDFFCQPPKKNSFCLFKCHSKQNDVYP